MRTHTKIYYEYHKIDPCDWVGCLVCGASANDIHHIEPKGMGGRKSADKIENLIPLCRRCHERAHANQFTKEYLKALL